MVLIKISVRPKSAYAKPNLVQEATVDSSIRLEALIAELKLPKKGTILYLHGRELPLNSSLATHNVQAGDILECCSSPMISAVLSAVLNDLNAVNKLAEDERTEDRIRPLLLDDTHLSQHSHQYLIPWPEQWSSEEVKTRTICLAHIKKIIQRSERYEHWEIPQIDSLECLYSFLENASNRHSIIGLKSITRVFSPSTRNRPGKPSTVWELLEYKLHELSNLVTAADHLSGGTDLIESFVRSEYARRNPSTPANNTGSPLKRTNRVVASGRSAETPRPRKRQRRTIPTPPGSATNDNTTCSCGERVVDSVCLEADCVFQNKICCHLCFYADHPASTRNHARVPLVDPRAKAILKQQASSKRKEDYCPTYASGPFAVLSALYKATMGGNGRRRREFSLSESILKQRAQLLCRSNLYDHQARGRNAFACMEKLTDDGLVRKEIVPLGLGGGAEECKFSLLPKGERLAKFCWFFEHTVTATLQTPAICNGLASIIGRCNQHQKRVSIIVDSREDGAYAQRLTQRCKDEAVGCSQKELRAGDYLFSFQQNGPETETFIFPLVIERKSWSDLADSIRGRGRGHRRLDCVRLGSDGQCSTGSCQLCRMKRSGCSKVMFIVEGARCRRRTDQQDKCDPSVKLCQYCQELKDRHGVDCLQKDLEQAIYKLQAQHRCLVHFTRDYNETIESLLILRSIIEKTLRDESSLFGNNDEDVDLARALALSKDESIPQSNAKMHKLIKLNDFQSNASRGRGNESSLVEAFAQIRTVNRMTAESLIMDIADGIVQVHSNDRSPRETVDTVSRQLSLSQEVVELYHSSDEEENAQESQDSIQILEETEWKRVSHRKESKQGLGEDDVIVLDDDEGQNTKANAIDLVVLDDGHEKEGATSRGTGTELLLLTGMYDYDVEFYDDINKLWQKIFRKNSSADITITDDNSLESSSIESSSFGKEIRQSLLQIQQGDVKTPLVPRKAVLAWLLYLQLVGGPLVHLVREEACAEELTAICQGKRRSEGDDCVQVSRSSEKPLVSEAAVSCRSIRPPLSARRSTVDRRTHRVSSTDASIREARLRRFAQHINVDISRARDPCREAPLTECEWACDKCTFLNPDDAFCCKACQEPCPLKFSAARLPAPAVAAADPHFASPQKEWSRYASAPQKWKCKLCTFENTADKHECLMCESPHCATLGAVAAAAATRSSDGPRSRSNFYVGQAESASSATKRIKCGACGLQGHNRATATAVSCPHYNNPEEKKLRLKKKEKAEEQAREKEQQIKRITESKEEARQKAEELRRNMDELQASVNTRAAQDEDMARRLEREVERHRRRARQYD